MVSSNLHPENRTHHRPTKQLALLMSWRGLQDAKRSLTPSTAKIGIIWLLKPTFLTQPQTKRPIKNNKISCREVSKIMATSRTLCRNWWTKRRVPLCQRVPINTSRGTWHPTLPHRLTTELTKSQPPSSCKWEWTLEVVPCVVPSSEIWTSLLRDKWSRIKKRQKLLTYTTC